VLPPLVIGLSLLILFHLPVRGSNLESEIQRWVGLRVTYAEPAVVLAEAVRVAAEGGLQFHRDLARPRDEEELARLVTKYAGDATAFQRKLFSESLRAALTLEEAQSLVASFGLAPETVRMTSDRHWTWVA